MKSEVSPWEYSLLPHFWSGRKELLKITREILEEEPQRQLPSVFTNMDFLGLEEVLCFKNSWCFSKRRLGAISHSPHA